MRGLDQRKRKWPRWLVEERGEKWVDGREPRVNQRASLCPVKRLEVNERRRKRRRDNDLIEQQQQQQKAIKKTRVKEEREKREGGRERR